MQWSANGNDLTVSGYRLVTVDDLKRDAESIAICRRQRHHEGACTPNMGSATPGSSATSRRTCWSISVTTSAHSARQCGRLPATSAARFTARTRAERLAHGVEHPQAHANVAAKCALVMNAIGNPRKERGTATTAISAAVIIGDKADVHRSRAEPAHGRFRHPRPRQLCGQA